MRRFLHIDITRRAMAQKLIGVPKPVGKRGKHFQRDIGTTAHKRQKVLAREQSQPRIFSHHRVGRAALPVEQSHFAKEIAAAQRR